MPKVKGMFLVSINYVLYAKNLEGLESEIINKKPGAKFLTLGTLAHL